MVGRRSEVAVAVRVKNQEQAPRRPNTVIRPFGGSTSGKHPNAPRPKVDHGVDIVSIRSRPRRPKFLGNGSTSRANTARARKNRPQRLLNINKDDYPTSDLYQLINLFFYTILKELFKGVIKGSISSFWLFCKISSHRHRFTNILIHCIASHRISKILSLPA